MDSRKTGSLIGSLRKENHLTQRELAEKLNISDKTVSKWECGQGCPDITLLPVLSRVFGVDIEKILTGELDENQADGGNMKKIQFYRCPLCGTILTGTGSAAISCCGRKLDVLVSAKNDAAHTASIEETDDELYVSLNHPMTKDHYIAFAAYVTFSSVLLVRLYPEQEAAFQMPKMYGGTFYAYCVNDGFFRLS